MSFVCSVCYGLHSYIKEAEEHVKKIIKKRKYIYNIYWEKNCVYVAPTVLTCGVQGPGGPKLLPSRHS